MEQSNSFRQVLNGLRAGDGAAWDTLVRRFAGALIALARQHLNTRIRQKTDPEDVIQSVFRSFFRRSAGGQFSLDNWDSLWGLLVRVTLNKCADVIRACDARKRQVTDEVPLSPEDERGGWEPAGRDPTPADAAVLADLVEQLMAPLDPDERATLERLLQGHTKPEISGELGCSERTVFRVQKRVREHLRRLLADAEGGAGTASAGRNP